MQFSEIFNFLEMIKWTKILNILLTIVFFLIALKISKTFLGHIFNKIKTKITDIEAIKNLETLHIISVNAINFLLFVFVSVNILNQLGVDVRPIITAAGVLGVAVGFGSQKFVEDLITGLTILLEGQIRVNDVVEIQGITGTVEKMTLCLVVLRSVDGCAHYIRNGMIDKITNYTRGFSYALMNITVAYKENIAQVMQVIKNLGDNFVQDEEFKNKVDGNIEILGLDGFNDSSITISFRIKTLPKMQWDVKRAFNLRIKEKFDELGIEIPFNQLVITQNKD